jgi:hypothetical protein
MISFTGYPNLRERLPVQQPASGAARSPVFAGPQSVRQTPTPPQGANGDHFQHRQPVAPEREASVKPVSAPGFTGTPKFGMDDGALIPLAVPKWPPPFSPMEEDAVMYSSSDEDIPEKEDIFMHSSSSEKDIPEDKNIPKHSALHIAAKQGHLGEVSRLSRKYPDDINMTDDTGKTPLIHAAESGHLNVARLLLFNNKRAINRADDDGKDALTHAIEKDHPEIVRFLAGHQEIPQQALKNALRMAVQKGQIDNTGILLTHIEDLPGAFQSIQKHFLFQPLKMAQAHYILIEGASKEGNQKAKGLLGTAIGDFSEYGYMVTADYLLNRKESHWRKLPAATIYPINPDEYEANRSKGSNQHEPRQG